MVNFFKDYRHLFIVINNFLFKGGLVLDRIQPFSLFSNGLEQLVLLTSKEIEQDGVLESIELTLNDYIFHSIFFVRLNLFIRQLIFLNLINFKF